MKILVISLFIMSINVAYLQSDIFYPILKKSNNIKRNIPIHKDSVVIFELKTIKGVINLYTLSSCIVENDSLIKINSIVLPYNNYVLVDNIIYKVVKSNDSTKIYMDTIYSKNNFHIMDGVYQKKEVLIYNKFTKMVCWNVDNYTYYLCKWNYRLRRSGNTPNGTFKKK